MSKGGCEGGKEEEKEGGSDSEEDTKDPKDDLIKVHTLYTKS